ncbi:MAG: BlaI/MecI/CopY family transcriptional regulator [Fuerstiella sp.]
MISDAVPFAMYAEDAPFIVLLQADRANGARRDRACNSCSIAGVRERSFSGNPAFVLDNVHLNVIDQGATTDMKNLPHLPKAQLEIAQIVWRLKNATVRQVVDELPEDRGLDFWTVQTYLRRLAQKGYLKSRKDGRSNVYSAAVDPKRVVREVFDETVERLFDGEAIPAFQLLIQDRRLTIEEIDYLQAELEELKSQRQKKRR